MHVNGLLRWARLIQWLTDTEERGDAAALDAALPTGGKNMGTTNADRIISTAKPTRTSTRVTFHCRFGLFMQSFLSPCVWLKQFSDHIAAIASPFDTLGI